MKNITYEQELQLHESLKIPFFEGWYFRFVSDEFSAAIILGIARTAENQEAFIQVFHTEAQIMEKASYNQDEWRYQAKPFELHIGRSVFLGNYLHIEDTRLSRVFDFQFQNAVHIHQSVYAPTIMGPFAYLKNMQCNHAIINLGSRAVCFMENNQQILKRKGIVYQEKDWGTSFPQRYIWAQSNCCDEQPAALFFSCAAIPLGLFHFTGIIMVVKDQHTEYRFASYHGAVLTKARSNENGFYLCIRQGFYQIECTIRMNTAFQLEAPQQGEMNRIVQECLLGHVDLYISRCGKRIRKLTFHHCGIENDHFFS
ncbi:hypothetical protein GSF08_00760 [Clostridiaceae bacterium DONG20-135]|uniref:Tocopherol cyclase-like protein n=1 Tax=Copranaerobaculum intestinale TaxID=2692629 RepID=A0A6N8U2M7_9FIRM|nr:tocopherol cyclase family protein [Copranaerobaculum intestinale]MXQ72472.1 hypothetical protein [Copranaerobaculum intestinale]